MPRRKTHHTKASVSGITKLRSKKKSLPLSLESVDLLSLQAGIVNTVRGGNAVMSVPKGEAARSLWLPIEPEREGKKIGDVEVEVEGVEGMKIDGGEEGLEGLLDGLKKI